MSNSESIIVLASTSPRRRELLEQIGVRYRVEAVDIDETIIDGESACDYVQRLSLEKARAGSKVTDNQFVTLGADTCIEIDNEILGKPEDLKTAADMLQRLSGREHIVHTGVAVRSEAMEAVLVNTSQVSFAKLEQNMIDAYIETGEPLGKAGAYAIQGIAAQFITKLTGSYSSVMGLPLYETAVLLQRYGITTVR